MAQNIDYSRNSGQMSMDDILHELGVTNYKTKRKIKNSIDKTASFNERTIRRAREMMDYLTENGYDYELEPRRDNKGVFAKVKGLGDLNTRVTLLASDSKYFDGSNVVGNVSVNGRNYYLQNNRYRKQSHPYAERPEFIFDSLLKGEATLKAETANRSDSKFDTKYLVYRDEVRDNDGNLTPVSTIFRSKKGQLERELDAEQEIEGFTYYDRLDSDSKLYHLAMDARENLARDVDENGMVTFQTIGSSDSYEIESLDFEIDNLDTLEGINLETILKYNDREILSEALAEEMQNNENFSLESDSVIASPELKAVLTEKLAGINADRVEARDLGENYEEFLEFTKDSLQNAGLEVSDIYFDEDHVVHYKGEIPDYYQMGKNKHEAKEVEGKIGQIFLPDERGLIRTKYNVLEGDEGRNYNIVPGYEAYLLAKDKPIIKPLTTMAEDSKGIEREYIADADGNPLYIYNSDGTNKRKVEAYKIGQKELGMLNKHIQNVREKNLGNEEFLKNVKDFGYYEAMPELGDRIRLRGYEQQLHRGVNAVITSQVVLGDNRATDGSILNKYYHGDVYGYRVNDKQAERDEVVRTYRSRVKFPDSFKEISSNEELGAYIKHDAEGNMLKDDKGNPEYEPTSVRSNFDSFNGIFCPILSSEGQSLGMVRYLVDGTEVGKDGTIQKARDGHLKYAPVIHHLKNPECNPGDRVLMHANGYMRAEAVMEKQKTAFMNLGGGEMEDGIILNPSLAESYGLERNGRDEDGNIIPVVTGDKAMFGHGAKGTFYIPPEDSPEAKFFKENPDLDIVVDPSSPIGRNNMGLFKEMQYNNNFGEVYKDGKAIDGVKWGELDLIITDISAESKTQTYEREYDADGNLIKAPNKKGRSFGVQTAWAARALGLDNVMEEVYSNNSNAFEELRAYTNVTGIDIDEELIPTYGQGFLNKVENGKAIPVGVEIVQPSEDLELPSTNETSALELPVTIDLESGGKSSYVSILPEKYRRGMDEIDGKLSPHEYTNQYNRISRAALNFTSLVDRLKEENENDVDLSTVDFKDNKQIEELRGTLSKAEFAEIEKAKSDIQGQYNGLSSDIVSRKLGGRGDFVAEDKYMPDSKSAKRSIFRRDILSKEVPNSVTAVVTNDPDADMNTIRVSPDVYDRLDIENEDDRVLMWRDPVLKDGSMRAFKIEKDENITGVSVNPVITESFGMDFDGDTLAIYAPKSKEAQQDLKEKAAYEKHLLDPVTGKFSGNVGMAFTYAMTDAGWIGEKPTAGPNAGQTFDTTEYNGKDQLEDILTDMAKEDDGYEKINQLWKDNVRSYEHGFGTIGIDPSSRDSLVKSLKSITDTGAKGTRDSVENDNQRQIAEFAKKKETTVAEQYPKLVQSQNQLENRGNAKFTPSKPNNMEYLDRGTFMTEAREKLGKDLDGDKELRKELEYLMDSHNRVSVKNEKTGQVQKVPTTKRVSAYANDLNNTRDAQGAKVDVTGIAGAKSQKLAGLAYDDSEKMKSAMAITEPLTQATLKLKHDPADVPKVNEILMDFDEIMNEGGLTNEEFKAKFKKSYEKMGLDLNDKHLDDVFSLVEGEKDGKKTGRTISIDDAIMERMSPLAKANLHGYDAIEQMAAKNSRILNRECLEGPKDKLEYAYELESFKDGAGASLHCPDKDRLKGVMRDSVKDFAMLHKKKGIDKSFEKYIEDREQAFQERQQKLAEKNRERMEARKFKYEEDKAVNERIRELKEENRRKKEAGKQVEKDDGFDLEM